MNQPEFTLGIVGGGLAGLAAAWQLKQTLPAARIVLFEKNDRLGGVLRTEQVGGYLIDHSADMFTTEPPTAWQLCQQLNRTADVIETTPVPQRAYVATASGIVPVPAGFSLMLPYDTEAVVRSGLLDDDGAERFLQEQEIPAKLDAEDESLESFAVRRFGRQVFDRLIQPLVSGIYTADPARLSMQATMARFVALEKEHASLIRAAAVQTRRKLNDHRQNPLAFADQAASGARYDLFRAPRQGMGQLVDWIVDALQQQGVVIRTGVAISAMQQTGRTWRLKTRRETLPENYDGLILANSSCAAARLLRPGHASLANELDEIRAANCAIVILGMEQSQFLQPFEGYGIVVPAYLNHQLIAVSAASNKFPGRAPAGKILLRCFLGGALHPEAVDFSDEQLIETARTELQCWLPHRGSPELARVFRWRETMPQYHVGHLDRVSQIDREIKQISGLELAGNSYQGVGIPVCIDSGKTAANKLAKELANHVSNRC